MTHLKGMHEIVGLQTLRGSPTKNGRGSLTAKLSRLDHQRNLLERQFAVWTEKRNVTQQRLALLKSEIMGLERQLRALAERPRSGHARPARDAGAAPAKAPARRHEMPFEY